MNEHKDTILRFQTHKYGMGAFTFTPQPGQRYSAVVSAAGSTRVQPLPAALPEGHVMQVKTLNEQQIRVSVQARTEDKLLYLLVHSRQGLQVVKRGLLQGGSTEFLVDRQKLPEGISCLTLFNEAREPVCERLYFLQPKGKLLLECLPDRQVYGKRQNITLQLRTGKEGGSRW